MLRPLILIAASACVGDIGTPRGIDTGGPGNPGTGGGIGGTGGGAPTRLDCSSAPHASASEGRRITVAQYNNAISSIFNGVITPSTQYPGTYGKSITGYTTEPAINDIGSTGIDSILFAAEDVALALQPKLATLLPCTTTTHNDTCAGTFIDTFVRRAYRRAPTADERANLLGTFHDAQTAGATFTEAVCMMTAHALQSPGFVYVLEDAAPTARALSGDEIASRLSFMLWDSIPDDALLDAAQNGGLATPADVTAQAERMLDASNADGALSRFFREWTGTVPLVPGNKDLTLFPDLDDALAQSINDSFNRFASDAIRNHSTLNDTLTGTSTFVDAQLASFFGVTPPPAGQWQKQSLDTTHYAGVMTQPAMMASLAHTAQASFVFRGKFVRERLLCIPLGSPPANAQAVFAGLTLPPNPTGKEVGAGITANVACSGCHTLINPPGLAFENFDAVGHFQQTYPSGRAIDPSGTMPLNGETLVFADQTKLMQQVAARAETSSCFGKQVFRFALSRQETAADGCALQTMGDALSSSNGDLRSAVVALAGSDAFNWKVDP